MTDNKVQLRNRILYGLISGLVYAIVMSIYWYFDDKPFSIEKFLLNVVVFGVIMSLIFRLKSNKKKN